MVTVAVMSSAAPNATTPATDGSTAVRVTVKSSADSMAWSAVMAIGRRNRPVSAPRTNGARMSWPAPMSVVSAASASPDSAYLRTMLAAGTKPPLTCTVNSAIWPSLTVAGSGASTVTVNASLSMMWMSTLPLKVTLPLMEPTSSCQRMASVGSFKVSSGKSSGITNGLEVTSATKLLRVSPRTCGSSSSSGAIASAIARRVPDMMTCGPNSPPVKVTVTCAAPPSVTSNRAGVTSMPGVSAPCNRRRKVWRLLSAPAMRARLGGAGSLNTNRRRSSASSRLSAQKCTRMFCRSTAGRAANSSVPDGMEVNGRPAGSQKSAALTLRSTREASTVSSAWNAHRTLKVSPNGGGRFRVTGKSYGRPSVSGQVALAPPGRATLNSGCAV